MLQKILALFYKYRQKNCHIGMRISGQRCYPKFSIGTLPKLHFIEAIRSAPHRDWLALIMPLWGAPGDPEVSSLTRFFTVLQKRASTKTRLKGQYKPSPFSRVTVARFVTRTCNKRRDMYKT